MLLNALFCTALIAAVAMTTLSAGMAIARSGAHRLAESLVAGGYQTAIGSVETRLSADMQNGGLPSPLPAPTALPAQCAGSDCKYSISETVAFTSSLAAPASTCDTFNTNCAQAEQGNPYIGESRVTSHVTIVVSDANGNSLVTRAADLTFRTFHRPPYVSFAGFRDENFDDVASDRASGDDGGIAASTPDPCASDAPGTADDTSVRVAYENSQSNACIDGSAFQSQPYSQPSTAPAGWSP
ncbi:MAG TPA: hypothetical protein VGZ02_07435 [Candidatus Baltobacteraceae bacterium]|nr:hypothetical protein [Candidatus Baltobacteraceae bacterium]